LRHFLHDEIEPVSNLRLLDCIGCGGMVVIRFDFDKIRDSRLRFRDIVRWRQVGERKSTGPSLFRFDSRNHRSLKISHPPARFFISAYGLLRSLGSETLATTGSLVLGIFLGVWLFVRWPSDYNLGRFSSWFARLILATLLTMSYSLIYDLLLIIPVIAFTFGVRGAQASALAFLYCAPILYFFLGSGAINLSPIALGWLFVAIDRSCPESYGTVVDLKTENISSSY
jgi:hypothetical protein